MKTTCEEVRDWVPRALMSDLAPGDERLLNAHLLECAACAGEQRLYVDTLSQVRSVSDVPVPKHFFVYPDERRSSFIGFLRAVNSRLEAGFQSGDRHHGNSCSLGSSAFSIPG